MTVNQLRDGIFLWELYHHCSTRQLYILPLILLIIILLKSSFFFEADPCHHYSNLSEANRNTKHQTPPYGTALCDSQLHEGWLSFCRSCRNKNANNACASIQMWYRLARLVGWCSSYSRRRTVCFSDRFAGCKSSNTISVKNCGSYFIYDFGLLYAYNARYCATD